jgi:hypothetical protein
VTAEHEQHLFAVARGPRLRRSGSACEHGLLECVKASA